MNECINALESIFEKYNEDNMEVIVMILDNKNVSIKANYCLKCLFEHLTEFYMKNKNEMHHEKGEEALTKAQDVMNKVIDDLFKDEEENDSDEKIH